MEADIAALLEAMGPDQPLRPAMTEAEVREALSYQDEYVGEDMGYDSEVDNRHGRVRSLDDHELDEYNAALDRERNLAEALVAYMIEHVDSARDRDDSVHETH
jgi:hypothetical protein